MQRNSFLINKKIHQYILSGILMTVAMQLGNVVDGMMVGKILGPDAMAAIEISRPVLLILQLPAMMLAMGGAAQAAVFLGKRDLPQADGIFSASLAAGAGLSLLFALFTPVLPGVLAMALAGNETLASLAESYIMVNFGGIPILTIAIIFCYFMNADNHPQLGSALVIVANVVNLALDVLFLKGFQMGMAGSALSTVIGYLTGMVTVLFYLRSRYRMLHIGRYSGNWLHDVGMAARAGVKSAVFTLMAALKSVLINSAIVRELGNDPMAVYSVCANAVLIAELCVSGMIGLIPNVAGILYGEKDYYGIRMLCRRVLLFSYAVIAVLLVLFLAVPQVITGLFGIDSGQMLSLCKTALRIFACSFPFYVYNKFLVAYYQTILQPGLSTMITSLQEFVVIVPLTLAGMFFWGLPGVCLSAVVSEAVTIVLAGRYRKWGQRSGRFAAADVYMLPEAEEQTTLDYSIGNRLEEVTAFREQLFSFCKAHGVRGRETRLLGLVVEEIAANIVKYGYRQEQKNDLDISFTIQDGKYILRFRDNGVPFDPLGQKLEKNELAVGGIALIRKIALNVQYMRVMNLNHTVVELERE